MQPGHRFAVGLVVGALAADVWLIRRGHEPISTVVRRSVVARAMVLALSAHLCATIPHDPLSAIGRRLSRG